ncbi:hypothetical protein, partial [Escherichia coli]|uniref:hypothetical protein n=1 Tax=Escherichia coli TaxID=562 RepID=UPI001BC83D92
YLAFSFVFLSFFFHCYCYRLTLPFPLRRQRQICIRARGYMVVYPHWRGELLDFNFFAARFCGLSPLARGTL